MVPTGQVTVDVDATGQEVREAEVRPEPNEGPSPGEASDSTRPRFKRRYFPDGGGDRPVVETDEPDEVAPKPSEGEDDRRRAARDIDDLLNDLDILDDDD